MMSTVVAQLLMHASSNPEKIALIVADEVLSYAVLRDRILAAVVFLQDNNIQSGDRVVLAAFSDPAFVYGYFASHLLGVICVPVDPAVGQNRLDYIVKSTTCRAVFGATDRDVSTALHFPISAFVSLNTPGGQTSFDFAKEYGIADILFTSGTTGDPKGVVLTHRSIMASAENINNFIGNTPGDKEVMPLPLSHSFGLGRLRCNIVKGACIILVSGFSSPANIYRAIDDHCATGFASVPAGFAVLLRNSNRNFGRYHRQLKYIEIGSSTMPLDDKLLLMDLLPATRICMHYGLTEASRSAFIEFHADRESLNSIGKPSPGVEIKVVDEQGGRCKPGVSGNLLVRGVHLMSCYWRNTMLSERALLDGWLLTGDVGHFDQDQYLYLDARESDIIRVGGRKVAPAEIEELLNLHSAVICSACVGIPDPRNISGFAVKAFLVAAADVQPPSPVELARLLRGKIEVYKMPVAYQWIKDIPCTESGKIMRKNLVDKYP